MLASRSRGVPATPPTEEGDRPTTERESTVPRSALRLDAATALGLCLVVAGYLAVSGWLLVAGDYRPYVFDNNESYSSFWHGYSLYHFGLEDGAGLTDEAFSPDPEAHPFLYTHQGNLPRLLSALLHAGGLRTIEGHIVATTLTVGLAGIVLAFSFFRAIGGPLFATLTSLLLVTDYVLAAQWSVVTYRVWHGVLLFGALLSATRRRPDRRWTDDAVFLLCSMALFYYELVFAAFASLATALFAASRRRDDRRGLVRVLVVQLIGAALGLGVLVVQLLVHFGWRVAAEDFYLTFVARNAARTDPSSLDRLDGFYRAHGIVFWFNLVDTTGFRAPGRFLEHVLEYHFQVYTPLLTLLVLVVAAGWLLGLAARATPWPRATVRDGTLRLAGRTGPSDRVPYVRLLVELTVAPALVPYLARVGRRADLLAGAAFGAACAALYLAIGRDEAFLGVEGAALGRRVAAVAIGIGAVAAGLAVLWVRRTKHRPAARAAGAATAGPTWRLLGAALFLLGTALAVRRLVPLYDQTLAPLWHGVLTLWLPVWLARAAVVAALVVGLGLLLVGPGELLGDCAAKQLRSVWGFLGVGFLAFAVVYYLSPGYIVSGYLVRTAPLLVFLAEPLLGVVLTAVLILARRGLGAAVPFAALRHADVPEIEPPRHRAGSRSLDGVLVRRGIGLASLAVGAMFLAQWVHAQVTYARLLPPDQFAFLGQLAEPALAGKSSATNLYGAPIAAWTGAWSYIDLTLARGEVELTEDGFVARQELQTFVWFADRGRNRAYETPDLYVCMRQQGMRTALARATGDMRDVETCNDVPIVARAANGTTPYLEHRVVARDQSPLGHWAILALDWDFPPYLRQPGGVSGRQAVIAELAAGPDGPHLNVRYEYDQQQGRVEGATSVRFEGQRPDGEPCLLAERTGAGPIPLPPTLRGTVRAVVVPRSDTKTGAAYASEPVVIGDATADPCGGR